jgi:hypothetical protein
VKRNEIVEISIQELCGLGAMCDETETIEPFTPFRGGYSKVRRSNKAEAAATGENTWWKGLRGWKDFPLDIKHLVVVVVVFNNLSITRTGYMIFSVVSTIFTLVVDGFRRIRVLSALGFYVS